MSADKEDVGEMTKNGQNKNDLAFFVYDEKFVEKVPWNIWKMQYKNAAISG